MILKKKNILKNFYYCNECDELMTIESRLAHIRKHERINESN